MPRYASKRHVRGIYCRPDKHVAIVQHSVGSRRQFHRVLWRLHSRTVRQIGSAFLPHYLPRGVCSALCVTDDMCLCLLAAVSTLLCGCHLDGSNCLGQIIHDCDGKAACLLFPGMYCLHPRKLVFLVMFPTQQRCLRAARNERQSSVTQHALDRPWDILPFNHANFWHVLLSSRDNACLTSSALLGDPVVLIHG